MPSAESVTVYGPRSCLRLSLTERDDSDSDNNAKAELALTAELIRVIIGGCTTVIRAPTYVRLHLSASGRELNSPIGLPCARQVDVGTYHGRDT